MSIDYTIRHDRKLVHAVLAGTLTEKGIFAYQREVWSKPEVAGYDEFIDASGVMDFEPMSAESVHHLAALSARMDAPPHPSKLAILAPGDAQFGMGRMYQIYREMETRGTKVVKVFRTSEEAMAWLADKEDN